MTPFKTVTGIAAPMPAPNVDTDVIMPKQFLKRIDRQGLAIGAFHDIRFDENGDKRPEFILNQPPYDQAKFLVCGANFGCGSSREYAVWGLMQIGVRAIIASSIAGIFFGNCEKNGLAAIILPEDEVQQLLAITGDARNSELTIDLPSQTILAANEQRFEFTMNSSRKSLLIEGADHVAITLESQSDIKQFEAQQAVSESWLWSH